MVRYSCTLGLERRLWPVVDGEHYHGEIMRFRLRVEPGDDAPEDAARDVSVELRVAGRLLARPAWARLTVREVTDHAMIWIRERLQAEGLPAHATVTYILNERTDDGAYLDGSPWAEAAPLAHRPFDVTCTRTLVVERRAQA